MARGSSMPETRYEMRRAMYDFLGAAKCKSCGAAIEWWQTTNGSRMPFDAPVSSDPENELAVTHFRTCPNAAQHRHGLPAEDIRHELITAANTIRRNMEAQHGRH